MAEDVIAEPGDVIAVGQSPSGGVEYHFPVQIEVRSTLEQADLHQIAQLVLTLLASAVKSQ